FLVGRNQAHLPGFVDGVGQRLLAVDVLAEAHRHDAGRGVRMVRRADGDGVELLGHLVEHLAVVEVPFRVFEPRGLFVEGVLVDVADGDDLAQTAGVVDVAVALATDADPGEAEFLARRVAGARRGGGGRSEPVTGTGGAGQLQKVTTIHERPRGVASQGTDRSAPGVEDSLGRISPVCNEASGRLAGGSNFGRFFFGKSVFHKLIIQNYNTPYSDEE